MSRSIAFLCTGAALVAGCSHSLSVQPMGANATEGAAYVLPFTQYDVTMTWRVVDCVTPRVALTTEATAGQADDADHAYVIDPASLQTLTSIGTFNAKWHDGSNALSSINVTAEDRTAQIIGNVVSGAAKLVPLFMGVPGLSGTASSQPPTCKQGAKDALASIADLKPKLAAATGKVEESIAEVARLNAKVVSMGGAVDDETKRKLSQEIDKLAAFRTEQNSLAEQLSGALKKITYIRKEKWPDHSRLNSGGPFIIPTDALGKWFDVAPSVPGVFLALERVGSFGRDPSTLANAAGGRVDSGVGLRYRVAAKGRLVACSATPCSSSNPSIVLTALEGPVAQLGFVHLLPVRNRTFGSTSFSAEFTPAGGLKSMGYDQKASPAEAASGAFASASGEVATALDPTARLQKKTAYLEGLKKLRDAQAALIPATEDPNAAATKVLESETAMLDAQAANIKAQLLLDELHAKLNPTGGQ